MSDSCFTMFYYVLLDLLVICHALHGNSADHPAEGAETLLDAASPPEVGSKNPTGEIHRERMVERC